MSAPHTLLHLASASPRRAQLLGEMGLRFAVEPTHVPEDEDPAAPPESLVKSNALAKARALARLRPTALILGCDTTVSLDNKNLNKPADLAEARVMLRCLSGRMHTVFTGICLIDGISGETFVEAVTSRVFFRPLEEDTISRYFAVVNPLDKAGAYGIQEGRALIIDRWEGSLSNIMGLPTERLAVVLAQRGLLEPLREIK